MDLTFMKTQRFNLPAGYDPPKLIEQLAHDYAVKVGTPCAQKLVLYDTFDWRLYQQSLVLFGAGNRLLLRRLDAEKGRVKEAFAQTFTGFAAPANKMLFKALYARSKKAVIS
jgi:hypothetical protein